MATEKLTNIEMENRLQSLEPLLELKGKIGYAASRNQRLLRSELTEFEKYKVDLLKKYGTENDDGSVSIAFSDPNFKDFENEIEEYALIEHEVNIMSVPISEAIESLTGNQITACIWMLEED